ncbi:MAG: hypothetical protein RJA70_3988 [Pseudomonadota bacterium]|jgi:DnaJ-domain-containing protein 1
MHAQDLAILKGLVSVAWADGRVAAEELEVIDALLAAYRATPSETRLIRRYAEVERSIDDIDLNSLSADDRRVLLQHAVLLTFIDGEQHQRERDVLQDLIDKLRIPPAVAERVSTAAEARARQMRSSMV